MQPVYGCFSGFPSLFFPAVRAVSTPASPLLAPYLPALVAPSTLSANPYTPRPFPGPYAWYGMLMLMLTGIETSVLRRLLRLPLPPPLPQPTQRRPTRIAYRWSSTRPQSSTRTSSRTLNSPCPAMSLFTSRSSAEERHPLRSRKAGDDWIGQGHQPRWWIEDRACTCALPTHPRSRGWCPRQPEAEARPARVV